MRVTENPQAARELLQQVRDRRRPRSGIHVSDLIYCLRKAWARRVYPGQAQETDEETLLFLLGEGHHGALEGMDRPETHVERDGIVGTIDRVEAVGEDLIVCEIKTTRASASKDIVGTPHYFEQLGAYAAMAGVKQGRLYVIHLMGAYKPPRPAIRSYEVEWTQEELENWWLALRTRALMLREAVEQGAPPDEVHRYPWECEYCPWKEVLGCETAKPASHDGGFFDCLSPAWERVWTA